MQEKEQKSGGNFWLNVAVTYGMASVFLFMLGLLMTFEKLIDSKIVAEKIESVFGKSNQIVVMVSVGDYEKEAIIDGITLTEKITSALY